MKRIDNNRVERILSVLVIAYGVYLLCVHAEDVLFFLYRFFYEGVDRRDFYWIGSTLRLLAGIFVIGFFPWIVRTICYFASGGMRRNQRHWTTRELLAAVIVCYALGGEILRYIFNFFDNFIVLCLYRDLLPEPAEWTVYLIWGMSCLTFTLFGISLLYFARSIAGWLLRRIEKQDAKPEREPTSPPL